MSLAAQESKAKSFKTIKGVTDVTNLFKDARRSLGLTANSLGRYLKNKDAKTAPTAYF